MDAAVFRYFSRLAKERNYSRAARSLFITPQGLSNAVRRLEDELGVRLVDSNKNGLFLTECGTAFARHADAISAQIDALHSDIEGIVNTQAAVIRLASSIGLMECLPPAAFEKYATSNSHGTAIHLDKIATDFTCEEELVAKRCDYALIVDPVSHSGLVSVPIYRDTMFCWMRADDSLAGKKELTRADFDGRTVGLFWDEYNQVQAIKAYFEQGESPCTFAAYQEMIEAFEAALAGEALAITTRTHAERIQIDEVACIPIADLPWGFSLVYRSDRSVLSSDEEFLAYMRSLARFRNGGKPS